MATVIIHHHYLTFIRLPDETDIDNMDLRVLITNDMS